MEYPLDSGELVEHGEFLRERFSSMQDHWLFDLEGKREHVPKERRLRFRLDLVVIGPMKIETDLADGNDTRMLRHRKQLAPLGARDRLGRRMRMTPDRGSQSGDALCQLDAGLVIARVVPNVDHSSDANGSRLLQRLLGTESVAQVQEMRVGIDQATGSGFSSRGNRTSPRLVWVRGASLPHCRAVAQGALTSALTCRAILLAVSGRNGLIR